MSAHAIHMVEREADDIFLSTAPYSDLKDLQVSSVVLLSIFIYLIVKQNQTTVKHL